MLNGSAGVSKKPARPATTKPVIAGHVNALNRRLGIIGRELPYNLEAERAVLGACMLSKEAIHKVRRVLEERAAFHDERNGAIWAAMLRLTDERVPVDLLTLTDELSKRGLLDKQQGPFKLTGLYLTELMSDVPTAEYAEHYARILFETDLLRDMIAKALGIVDRCTGSIGNPDAFEELDAARQAYNLVSLAAMGAPLTDGVYERPAALARIFEQVYDPAASQGYTTGLEKLDAAIGGLRGGELVTIAGRPGSGKSALMFSIAENLQGFGSDLCTPKHCVILELEMTEAQSWQRVLGYLARVGTHRFVQPGYVWTGHERRRLDAAMQQVKASRLYIETGSRYKLSELERRIERLKKDGLLDVLFIDQSNKLVNDLAKYWSKTDEIEGAFVWLKAAAKTYDIPIVIAHQLNRQCEMRNDGKYPIPMLSDLRDSGAVEQESDIVLMCFRPEYYGLPAFADGTPALNKGEVLVEKNRNGETVSCLLQYIAHLTRWDNNNTSYSLTSI